MSQFEIKDSENNINQGQLENFLSNGGDYTSLTCKMILSILHDFEHQLKITKGDLCYASKYPDSIKALKTLQLLVSWKQQKKNICIDF